MKATRKPAKQDSHPAFPKSPASPPYALASSKILSRNAQKTQRTFQRKQNVSFKELPSGGGSTKHLTSLQQQAFNSV